jgi:amino acid adenylation domain-containing protein
VNHLVHGFLERRAQQFPDKAAIVCDGATFSYIELWTRARRLAAILRRAGVERGDRVMIFVENRAECAIALYGTLMAGGAYTFISPQTKQEKLEFLLADAEPRVVITEPPLGARFATSLSAAKSVALVLSIGTPAEGQLDFVRELEQQTDEFDDPRTIALDLAALIYTSGSTGRPKGVMMAHQNMVFSIEALAGVFALGESDVVLSALPLSFNYGMYQILLSVAAGATLVLERNFTYPAHVVRRMGEVGATVFPGVPTMFARLATIHAKTPQLLPKVRCLTNTAAALPEDLVTVLNEIFPSAEIFRMYGLTECKRALYLEPRLGKERPGSVGKAMPGTEVFLRTADAEPVSDGDMGILHVRGPNVMLGYWKLPEESAKVLIPGRYPGERVYCTGDYFRVDADGFYYFLGRSDDIIKCRGEKVSPAEVEGALYGVTGMREAAVIGVPDPIFGEAVWAFVAMEPGFEKTEKELRSHCAQRLEIHQVPERIVILAELPKTQTGKISKQPLHGMVQQHRDRSSRTPGG